ncbi:MAG: hypothetical protein HZA81_01395 [Candidatus Taylorbacteria bacterium]|nr:hypothetical protein [Candidatus Taylorbacteria bacterium]
MEMSIGQMWAVLGIAREVIEEIRGVDFRNVQDVIKDDPEARKAFKAKLQRVMESGLCGDPTFGPPRIVPVQGLNLFELKFAPGEETFRHAKLNPLFVQAFNGIVEKEVRAERLALRKLRKKLDAESILEEIGADKIPALATFKKFYDICDMRIRYACFLRDVRGDIRFVRFTTTQIDAFPLDCVHDIEPDGWEFVSLS